MRNERLKLKRRLLSVAINYATPFVDILDSLTKKGKEMLSVHFSDGDDGDTFILGSSSEWKAAGEWVSSLTDEQRPLLSELVNKGETKNTRGLGVELLTLPIESAPTLAVRRVLRMLKEYTGIGDEEETVKIVD